MFNHVLVPLDYSPLSERALPYARHIVDSQGQLTLLTVIEDLQEIVGYGAGAGVLYYPTRLDEARENLRKQTEAYLNKLGAELQQPPARVDHIIEFGRPADAIVDVASQLGVDAIVMCTHGRSGFTRWLLGSVTQKVINAAPCPVLVIPGKDDSSQSKD
jgi:nucleotide-binding universal stress UspA family protein